MRLFIGTAVAGPAAEAAAAVIAAGRALPGAAVKWTAAGNLHLTWLYLGDTAEELLPAVKSAVDAAASGARAASALLGGLGAFPSPDKPRVLWLGLREAEPGALAACAAAVRARFPGAADKPFAPHVTIGRPKAAPPPGFYPALAAAAGFGAPLRFGEFTLYESRGGPGGPLYLPLHSAPLA